jgi:hypothetical protein
MKHESRRSKGNTCNYRSKKRCSKQKVGRAK